jgi:hypothetical protein
VANRVYLKKQFTFLDNSYKDSLQLASLPKYHWHCLFNHLHSVVKKPMVALHRTLTTSSGLQHYLLASSDGSTPWINRLTSEISIKQWILENQEGNFFIFFLCLFYDAKQMEGSSSLNMRGSITTKSTVGDEGILIKIGLGTILIFNAIEHNTIKRIETK